MLLRTLAAALLVLSLPAAAQAPAAAPTRAAPRPAATTAPSPAPSAARPSLALQMLAGSWALKVEETVMFRFDLVPTATGWSGTWVKPKSFASDGAIFAELSGPPAEQRSQSGRAIGDWAELAFGDARPGAIPDVFRFRLTGPDRAEMLYADTGQAPFVLERVDPGTPAGPWADGRVYRRTGVQPGSMVSYNVARRPTPLAEPAAPPATDRPPAVVGR
jgi:hypothetical protein